MTIDEQIKIFESNAEFERKDGDLQGCLNFRQLAEWLKNYKRLLERVPCDDCISRKQAIELFVGWWSDLLEYHKADECFDALLKDLPPVIPQQKIGKWKAFTHSAYHGNDDDGEPIWREVTVYHCNLCNRRTVIKEKYCPNCGADMRGDANVNDK